MRPTCQICGASVGYNTWPDGTIEYDEYCKDCDDECTDKPQGRTEQFVRLRIMQYRDKYGHPLDNCVDFLELEQLVDALLVVYQECNECFAGNPSLGSMERVQALLKEEGI